MELFATANIYHMYLWAKYGFKHEAQIDHAKESNIENVNLDITFSVGKYMLGSTNESVGRLLKHLLTKKYLNSGI